MSVVSFLQDLVRIDTPGNEELGIARAAAEMRRLDFDDVVVDQHGNLIGRVGPTGGRTLVVDGHIDTVPAYAPEAWHHDPFGAEIAGGHVYGRGTAQAHAVDEAVPVAEVEQAVQGYRSIFASVLGAP